MNDVDYVHSYQLDSENNHRLNASEELIKKQKTKTITKSKKAINNTQARKLDNDIKTNEESPMEKLKFIVIIFNPLDDVAILKIDISLLQSTY